MSPQSIHCKPNFQHIFIMNINFETLKILIPTFFTLIGIIIGNYLNHRNSYNLFMKQKKFENQRISYSRLMSLKNPWTQFITTHLEAKLLCEFYETRYILFSNNIEDLNESKRQNTRASDLIKEITLHQREVFETLGLIQTCFKLDLHLEDAINQLFNYQSIKINSFPKNFINQKELDNFLEELFKHTNLLIQEEYKNKVDNILNLLKSQLIK